GAEKHGSNRTRLLSQWFWKHLRVLGKDLNSNVVEDRRALAVVTGLRVGGELLNRITGQDKVDAYKKACILNIVQFLQQNPRASQAQINAEVQKNVVVFAAQVRALETAPLW
uniref:Si:ch211-191j22.3 n=1 Tax=Oryzias latipes TaxID=8090 RepID=A0A3B3HQ77_ORYLA